MQVGGIFYIGNGATSTGTYTLGGGQIDVTGAAQIGYNGLGVMMQDDGTANFTEFRLGQQAGGAGGTYILDDGVVNVSNWLLPGVNTEGVFIQNGGTVNKTGANYISIGRNTKATGTYILNNDAVLISDGLLQVGYKGNNTTVAEGVFLHNNGTVIVDDLEIAAEQDTVGTYKIESGLLRVLTGGDDGISEVKDSNDGSGYIIQNGGRVEFVEGSLRLGEGNNVSYGEYQMNGGTLVVGAILRMGEGNGNGTFQHNNGLVQIADEIIIGDSATSAEYAMVDGRLEVGDTIRVAFDNGPGTFRQSGGEVVGNRVWVGRTGTDALYALSGGTLTAGRERIEKLNVSLGESVFNQSGGTNIAGSVLVGAAGTYDYTGGVMDKGSLQIRDGGVMDFNGATVALTLTSGLYELAGGTAGGQVLNGANASLTLGSSVILISDGSDASAGWGSFSSSAMTAVKGGSFTLGAGTTLANGGFFPAHMNVAGGTIALTIAGDGLDLDQGLTLSGDAVVDLGIGDLYVDDLVSGISGGSLTVNSMYVGTLGTGRFTQTGGVVNVTSPTTLVVGDGAGNIGSYSLSTGDLSVSGNVVVGDNGGEGFFDVSGGSMDVSGDLLMADNGSGSQARFTQTGGEVNVVGGLQGGDGNAANLSIYTLTAGTLNVGGESWIAVVNSANGQFIQSGGEANFAGKLWITEGGFGSYDLSDGELNVGGDLVLTQNNARDGFVNQSGGTATVGGDLVMLNAGGNADTIGHYTLSGGTLHVIGEVKDSDAAGDGALDYDGGVLIVDTGNIQTPRFRLANNVSDNVTYTHSTGIIDTSAALNVGRVGTGTLNQTGGTITGEGTLYVGGDATGIGTYNLSGGEVSIATVAVGGLGQGVLNHTNGLINGGALDVGASAGGVGTYNVSGTATTDIGGQLRIGNSGSGVMNQTGGDLLVNNFLVGYGATGVGEYNLSGGTITTDAGGSEVGGLNGVGVMNHTGGTVYAGQATAASNYNTRDFSVGGTNAASIGTYNITNDAALLRVSKLFRVGYTGDGVFNQSAGTVEALGLSQGGGGTVKQNSMVLGENDGGTGIYNLTGGTLTSSGTQTLVGEDGSGTLIVSGTGVANITKFLFGTGATGVGTVQVDGGTLTVGDIAAGAAGDGYLLLNVDGSLTVTDTAWEVQRFHIGDSTTSDVHFTIATGDAITATTQLIVGKYGTGTLTQTGGLYEGANGATAYIGDQAGSVGSFMISGGSFIAGGHLEVGATGGVGYVEQTGGVVISGEGDAGNTEGQFRIGAHDGASATYLLVDGIVASNEGGFHIAEAANSHGVFIMKAGTVGADWMDYNDGIAAGRTFSMGAGAGSDGTFIMESGLAVITNDLRIGGQGTGVMTMSGGTVLASAGMGNTVQSDMADGANGYGELNLSAGLIDMDGSFVLSDGAGGNSIVNQTGGQIDVATQLWVGKDSTATWTMTDGTVNVGERLLLGVFANGVGVFNQSGGTVNVTGEYTANDGWDFGLGWGSDAKGTYNLSGGSLVVEYDSMVGKASTNTAVMNITGGVFKTGYGTAGEEARDLVLGADANGVGVVNLSGTGTLDVAGNIVTGAGQGRFNLDGSTLIVGGGTIGGSRFTVAIGNEAGDDSTLAVDGSQLSELSPSILYVGIDGAGTVNQSTGLVYTGYTEIGASGQFNYTGGTFGVRGGIAGDGVIDFGSAAGSLDTDSVLVDLADLTVQNHGSLGVNLGSDSLVIVSALGDLDGFGSFTGTAKTMFVGSAATFATAEGFTGWGSVDDLIVMNADAGTVQKTPTDVDSWLHLLGGLEIAGGTVNVTTIGGLSQSGGTVTTDLLIIDHIEGSTPGDISGGQLNVGTLKVATIGTGLFTQSGGEVNVTGTDTFVIGESAGSTGTYLLQAGDLNQAGSILIGDAGTGVMIQTGGNHAASGLDVFVGNQSTGDGEYQLGTGTVTANNFYVGHDGTGDLDVSGGTMNLTQLRVGFNAGSSGSVSVTNGLVDQSSSMVVGWGGTGYMSYTGGEVNVGLNLHVGYQGGDGELIVTGTTLDVAGNIQVGDESGSVGVVTQTNATVNVGDVLYLGDQAGASGSYTLNSGVLVAAQQGWIGNSGTGVFIQNGGTAVFAQSGGGSLSVGDSSGGVGTYIINDGVMLALNGRLNAGDSGTGYIEQNGGYVRSGNWTGMLYSDLALDDDDVRDSGIGNEAGGQGTYVLNNGTYFCTSTMHIATTATSTGVMIQNGGTFINERPAPTASSNLNIGEDGTGSYLLTGGLMQVGLNDQSGTTQIRVGLNNGSYGEFILTGGTLQAEHNVVVGNAATASGSVDVSGTAVMELAGALVVGNNGVGVVNQSGGVVTVGDGVGDDYIATGTASGAGTYALSGGTLNVNGEVRLGANDFTFDVTGGVANIDRFDVGRAGSDRTFSQAAAEINANDLRVGGGDGAAGIGTYNLSGGSLDAETLTLDYTGDSTGIFNWTGGDLSGGTFNINLGGRFNGAPADLTIEMLNVGGDASVLMDMGTKGLTATAGGTFSAGMIRAGDFTVGGLFTQTGGSVELTASSVTVASGGTYALGDLFSTGAIVEDAAGANLTVNADGVFTGWTDKAGNGGVDMSGTLDNNGTVVADGFGIPASTVSTGRTLDLTSFTAVDHTDTPQGPTGTAGWYAQNQGTLALPPVAIAGAGTYNWGEAAAPATPDLVNSLQLTFTSINTAFEAEISLLSNDDPAVVADMNSDWDWIGVQFIGVWLFEDNNDTPGSDDFLGEPGQLADWSVMFRYDDVLLQDLLTNDPLLSTGGYDVNDLRVYYYDEDLGDWVMLNVDITQELDAANNLIWIPDDAGRGEGMYAIVIPEPGTMAILALGGVGMLLRRRKRKAA